MKLKIKIFLIVFFILLNSCSHEKFIIFIDELSEVYGNEVVKEYKKKFPEKYFEVYIYNTDFLFQSIKIGRIPHVFISFDTSYSQKWGLSFPKKRLLQRDAIVLAVSDSQLHSWNDILTKGKYLALPMQNNALQKWVYPYLDYQRVSHEEFSPIYPHDFKGMSLYLKKKMITAGIMLKSQADYYQLRSLFPYFHQSFIHYTVELKPLH